MMGVALSWAKLAGMIAIAAEAFPRLGVPFLAWCGRGRMSPQERLGAASLLGIGVLGTAYLGLAAAGLFFPVVLVGVLVAGVGGSRAGWCRRSMFYDAMAGWCRAAGAPGAVLAGLALVPAVLHLVLPDMNQDVWCYHFALPSQYLLIHRMLLDHINVAYTLSVPVDMTFALGLVAGDDRLAKGLMLVCFVAATASWAERGRAGAALWLAPVLVLATAHLEELLACGKNDLAGAALFVAGAGMSRRGQWGTAAWLFGWSLAAKLVLLPFVGLWALVFFPPARMWAWVAAGLILPTVPWSATQWLATGHPTASFLAAGVMPAFNWGPLNQQVFLNYAQGFWLKAAESADIAALWLRFMKADHLALLLLLPGLLLFGRGRTRWAAAGCAIAIGAVLWGAHVPRYVVVAAWTLAALAGAEAGGLTGRLARVGIAGLAATRLLHIATATDLWRTNWRDALEAGNAAETRLLSTYGQAMTWMQSLHVRRVLNIGELRTYRFPGRAVFGGTCGETPLMWQLVKESGTADRLRVKIRQCGASHLLYNYISADWLANRYIPFAWTPPMLAVYREYAINHFELIGTSDGNDFGNGGFCLFRINAAPVKPRQKSILFLPGTEQLYGESIALESLKRPKEAMESCQRMLALMPDVGHAWNAMGHAYAVMGDAPKAYAHLIKFGSMMDQLNVPELAWAALRVGQIDMAEQLLQFSITRYPDQIGTIHVNLAQVREQRASMLLMQRKSKDAAKWLADAEQHMAVVPAETPNMALRESRRLVLATLWALKGELAIQTGDNTNAVACIRQALNLSPDDVMAPRWKAAIKALPLTFSSLGEGK